MMLTFKQRQNSQEISLQELNDFQTLIGFTLPQDYRQHMLEHNGSMVMQNVKHVNYPDGGEGISYFYPIKYGSYTMEQSFTNLNGKIPSGTLSIGTTDNGGEILIYLNNDANYGKISEWFPDGELFELSPSFTQLLNDMVESDE